MKPTISAILLLFVVSLPASAQEKWVTPSEASGYKTTPDYEQTMDYLRRVERAAPGQVRIEAFGRTGEGRDLHAVMLSRDGQFDPVEIKKQKRPVLLAINGIHGGEIDGKDASLELVRDIVINKKHARLLDGVFVVIVPVYNLDGHERRSPYNRINQNGPAEQGWRANAAGLNLNRDFLKADAPETRALLQLWRKWSPDFFLDNHVTDGAGHRMDTQWSVDSGPDVNRQLAEWVQAKLTPDLNRRISAAGHNPAPYIEVKDDDPANGFGMTQSTPRFSTGFAVLHNRPGMLVEMHSHTPYAQRVSGNYALMVGLLEILNRDADALLKINQDADAAQVEVGKSYDPQRTMPLFLTNTGEPVRFAFKGYKYWRELSAVSGAMRTVYTEEPMEMEIPFRNRLKVSYAVTPPRAYIIPGQWTEVIEVLAEHGVRMSRTTAPWTAEVETYRCTAKWSAKPFEGRVTLVPDDIGRPAQCERVREKMRFPRDSAVVPMDQPGARIAIHWLEPEAPDSALGWGFFNPIFEQKEYGSPWVVEKMAREMLEKNPKLKADFEEKVQNDREFAGNPQARLAWFYERSPWWDQRIGLYPVGKLTRLDGAPVR